MVRERVHKTHRNDAQEPLSRYRRQKYFVFFLLYSCRVYSNISRNICYTTKNGSNDFSMAPHNEISIHHHSLRGCRPQHLPSSGVLQQQLLQHKRHRALVLEPPMGHQH